VANVRTATLAEDALRFEATRDIMPGEELRVDFAQVSNLEFIVKYGFAVEGNPYGGRQFDLAGEPLQAHCPSYILRFDTPEIIENSTVDCHRQARYLSFEQQFGQLQLHEQLREDHYIYHAVEEACQQLQSMLQMPHPLSEYEAQGGMDSVTSLLVHEIQKERALLQRCQEEFRRRQQEEQPRFVPDALAEPLARLWPGGSPRGLGGAEQVPSSFGAEANIYDTKSAHGLGAVSGFSNLVSGYSERPPSSAHSADERSYGSVGRTESLAGDNTGEAPSSFSASVDKGRVDQLLQRLQAGASLF
jgi:hypothetical protein